MLSLLHEGHIGIEKCRARARQLFYWPNISTDIENYITKCQICNKYAKKNCKEPLLSYPVPERPWERVGTDIFSYGNYRYLVLYDAYSNWLELLTIKDKSSGEVIKQFKKVFSRYGCPDTVICDNIPFTSYAMKQFAHEWNFNIVSRSPNYPQSNGLAEKAVSIAKNIVKRCIEENREIYPALMQYRNAPLKNMNATPAQLFLGRICKTKLPICDTLLKDKFDDKSLNDKLTHKQVASGKYYNQHVQTLPVLGKGDNVNVYNHVSKCWEGGKIVNEHSTPRSYLVETDSGVVRRNRVDLRKSEINYEPKCNLEETELSPPLIVSKKNSIVNMLPLAPSTLGSAPSVCTTRSGRVVKLPTKYKDYM